MNAIKISTSGDVSIVNMPSNGYIQLGFLRGCVDGSIERVCSEYGDIYVNEDGLMQGLESNSIASSIAQVPLAGNVVITGEDCESLSEAKIKKIKRLVESSARQWTDERPK